MKLIKAIEEAGKNAESGRVALGRILSLCFVERTHRWNGAIHRIKKAENPLRGRFLARLGLFFGYYRILVFAVVFWGFQNMH